MMTIESDIIGTAIAQATRRVCAVQGMINKPGAPLAICRVELAMAESDLMLAEIMLGCSHPLQTLLNEILELYEDIELIDDDGELL